MTGGENERLGVLEAEVAHIKTDVSEIKADVKQIVANQNSAAIDLAAKNAAEAAIRASRSSTGQWAKFFAERAIAIAAIIVSALAWLKG